MPEFQYVGVDKSGKRTQGKMDAPSDGDLRMILRGMGIRPVRIGKVSALNADLGKMFKGSGTVKLDSLVTFTRQLNVLISAGIPLVQALEVLSDQAYDKNLRSIIMATKEKVSAGAYLWESLAAYPRAFPKLYTALIRAGEMAGAMDQVLKRLSRYLEDSDRLRKMVKGAMMYPIIVTSIGIGVMSLLLTFVIPKFEELLKGNNQELPMPTQIVINASHFFTSNFLIIAGIVGGTFYMLKKYYESDEGRAFFDRLLFRVPLFGLIAQKSGVARFSRTMQTLLASGVNLIDAIDICRATIGNAVLEAAVSKVRKEVEAGKTLASVISRIEVFPKMAIQMISVGEATGSLDKMLEKVADFYESEVEVLVGGMSKMIEPIVLVVLGGMVGAMLIAMYLPIFKMAGGA